MLNNRVAELLIDPLDWHRLQQLDAHNPGTRILDHDYSHAGRMVVHIACASDQVRQRLEDAWG